MIVWWAISIVIVALIICAVARMPQEIWGAMQNPSVAILMFGTSDIMRQYGDIAVSINRQYAKRHGYELVIEEAASASHADSVWHMVSMMLTYLDVYSVVFFIDCDAVFAKQDQSLDWLISSSHDMVGCEDETNLVNTGAIFARNTRWTRTFLKKWMALKKIPRYNTWAYEQSALNDLLKKDVDRAVSRGHFSIRAAQEFNSIHAEVVEGRRDTFIVHLLATKPEYRRKELRKILRKTSRRS